MSASLPNKLVYRTGEVARLLGCTARTVAKLVDDGTIRGFRVGKDRRISRKDLIEYVREDPNKSYALEALGVDDGGDGEEGAE
jgi:excisionase family DNA binding protein